MGEDDRWIQVGPVQPLPEVKYSLGERLYRSLTEKSIDPLVINGATGESLSSDEVLLKGIRFALELNARGVRPGDVVTPALENCIEYSFMMLGTFLAGAVLAPVNPRLDSADLSHIFHMQSSRIIFTHREDFEKIQSLKPSHGEIVEVDYDSPNWQKFIEYKDVKSFSPTSVKDLDEPVLIVCSSGTTGRHKGVITTQRDMALLSQLDWLKLTPGRSINLVVASISWVTATFYTLLMLDTCQTQVFLPKFDVDTYLKTIEKYKVTTGMLAPQLLAALTKCGNAHKYDVSSLKTVLTAGDPISISVKEQAEKILKKRIVIYYGQTEVMFPFLVHGPKSPEKPLTCGMVAHNCSIKIADINTGKALGPNKDGEICIKVPLPFVGYYNNPEAIKDVVRSDGWHHTGDVGYYDEDGYFFVHDRIKELIKHKGIHISPAEIENVLLSHPGVSDAAVVGVFDDFDHERPIGFVIKRPGATVTKEELLQLIRDTLSEYKWLHGGVHFTAEIPRTPSGKIVRRELRQRAAQLSNI